MLLFTHRLIRHEIIQFPNLFEELRIVASAVFIIVLQLLEVSGIRNFSCVCLGDWGSALEGLDWVSANVVVFGRRFE